MTKHFKSGDKSTIKKIEKILKELEINPYSGTGKPEQLKFNLNGYWSRRINMKVRIKTIAKLTAYKFALFLA